MSITVNNVRDMIDEWAPFDSAMEGDNVGLLVGNGDATVTGILLALDLTLDVVEEAKEQGANLIITHHPVIFTPMKAITPASAQGRMVRALIKSDMSVICAHTNLDGADGGVSDVFAQRVGLSDIKVAEHNALMRIGKLESPMTVEQFAAKVKKECNALTVKWCGKEPKEVQTVAVVGGRGCSFLYDAIKTGADLYLLGEIKYENARYAETMDLCVMAAGHYDTEVLILDVVKSYLQKKLFDVQLEGCIRVTSKDHGPFSIIG